MGLFGDKETKEEKQERKAQKLLDKYGLSQVDAKDVESIKKIMLDLIGTGFIKTGMALTLSTKAEEQAKVAYLSALVEQNWIIIRQLDRLNKKMDAPYDSYNYID